MMNEKWYVGAMNDGLFVIDQPPSPSGTDVPPGEWRDVQVIAKVTGNDAEAMKRASKLAAAPELYDSLVELIARFKRAVIASGTDPEFAEAAVAREEAVLAKARGEV